jgi:hypothetical protein
MRVLSNEDLRWVSGGFETNCQFHQSDVEYAEQVVADLQEEADDLWDLEQIAFAVWNNDTYGSPTWDAHYAAWDNASKAWSAKNDEITQAVATANYVRNNACD